MGYSSDRQDQKEIPLGGVGSERRVYNLTKWDLVCHPKKQGGLGVSNLQFINTVLLAKWWWKVVIYSNKSVCKIMRKKYGNKYGAWSTGQVCKRNISHFW